MLKFRGDVHTKTRNVIFDFGDMDTNLPCMQTSNKVTLKIMMFSSLPYFSFPILFLTLPLLANPICYAIT